jgi:hypothetical protein
MFAAVREGAGESQASATPPPSIFLEINIEERGKYAKYECQQLEVFL